MGVRIFRKLFSGLKALFQASGSSIDLDDSLNIEQRAGVISEKTMSSDLETNLQQVRSLLGNSYDLNVRKFTIGRTEIPAAVIFISGLVNSQAIEGILADLTSEMFKTGLDREASAQEIFRVAEKRILRSEDTMPAQKIEMVFNRIFLGETTLLIDGVDRALICDTKQWEVRDVQEPESETTIRGLRDGFVESLRVNTSLIRRRIRSPNLWMESMEIGRVTKTEVAFAYLKGLAQEDLVNEVRKRLEDIDIDAILETGQLEELIADTSFTVFPLMQRTERTDIVAGNILEGRVVIFCEGSPFSLIVPSELPAHLQAPDDYFELFPVGSFIRLIRYIGFLLAIFLPGLYVAVINFHPELLPSTLLLRITAARQGTPFPAVGEVFIMEFIFELLREAGLRLPRMIGPAISIVGALILGDAAIRAGLVSPPVVVIVSLTAIASFSTPSFSFSIAGRLLRFIMIALGAILGFFGIQFGFLLFGIHLCSLRSFGYPYFAPVAPFIWDDMKDMIFRLPWWAQDSRPQLTGGRNPRSQKKDRQIEPPPGPGEQAE